MSFLSHPIASHRIVPPPRGRTRYFKRRGKKEKRKHYSFFGGGIILKWQINLLRERRGGEGEASKGVGTRVLYNMQQLDHWVQEAGVWMISNPPLLITKRPLSCLVPTTHYLTALPPLPLPALAFSLSPPFRTHLFSRSFLAQPH